MKLVVYGSLLVAGILACIFGVVRAMKTLEKAVEEVEERENGKSV